MAKPHNHPVREFEDFIEQASALRHDHTDTSLLRTFGEFIAEAKPLHEVLVRPPTFEFQTFVDKAVPLVLRSLQSDLPALKQRAELADRWLVADDLLAVAGLSYVENAYTELMAWALRPKTHRESALRRQTAWLESLEPKIELSNQERKPATVETQVATDDGIPDLILRFEHTVIVVEAKTGTVEHAAPSGTMQTIAYIPAVRHRYRIADESVYAVLISPDGQQAANEGQEARSTSYVAFALAMAYCLEAEQLPLDTRAAFKMLFTHFLTRATPTTEPVRDLLSKVKSLPEDWRSDGQMLEWLNILSAAMRTLFPEKQ